MLHIDNLTCKRGWQVLFTDLTIKLHAGDILRIGGANGKGKTSLLRIIAGLGYIESGQINLNNSQILSTKYQKNILYLGHLDALNPILSVLDNLLFLANLKQICTIAQVKQALVKMGLQYYDDQPCAHLSVGQRRRVLLAMLLLVEAKVWLLDEPFAALDTSGVALVESLVLDHCGGGGICLFTTHQFSCLNKYQLLDL